MKLTVLFASACALVIACHAPRSHAQTPLGTGFTYQGVLKQSGTPMNGTVSLRFTLWDAAGTGSPPSGGNQIGGMQQVTGVPISNGLFTVTLDGSGEFGAAAFNGQARFLQVEVCIDPSCASRTTLTPRQPLAPAPYAAFAGAPWTQPAPGGNSISYTAGGVGIGTTAPISKLHVDSGANANVDLVLNSGVSTAQYSAIDFFDRGVNRWSMGKDNGNGLFVAESGVATRMVIAQGGNVGFGTTAPTAKLDVRGDIRLGPSGQYRAAGGEENLRIVRGTVNANGIPTAGTGFLVGHAQSSVYNFTFSTAFSGPPSITVTCDNSTHNNGINLPVLYDVSASSFTVVTYNANDIPNSQDTPFHFIAIGPR